MWLRFKTKFDWKPKPSVTISYRADQEYNVTRECGEAAIKAGAAVKLRKTNKNEGATDDDG